MKKLEIKLFVLCGFNIANMTFLFIGLVFFEQLVSMSIEMILFGSVGYHWFDSAFCMIMSGSYFYLTNELGKFLLKLHLEGHVKQKDS